MKKYNFLFICAFLVFVSFLTESLQKRDKIWVKSIMIEPKARFAANGDTLYLYWRNDTLVVGITRKESSGRYTVTNSPYMEEGKVIFWDQIAAPLSKFVK